MVLVGPSGCGKTTALRMVAGLEEISDGELRIGDQHRQRPHAEGTEHRDGLPELRALPAHDGRGQPRLQPEAPQDAEEGGRGARPEGRQHPPDRGVPEAQAARALGRPAPARRDGPGDRPRARGVPDGRAPLEPRREAPRADACRDPPAPAAARRDDDLRHARPGRGDDDGRPRRGDERRAPAAGRHAAGALRPAEERVRRRLHRLSRDQPRRGPARADERSTRRQLRRAPADRRRSRRAKPLRVEGLRRSNGDPRHPARGLRGREHRAGRAERSANHGDLRPDGAARRRGARLRRDGRDRCRLERRNSRRRRGRGRPARRRRRRRPRPAFAPG